MAEGEKVLPTPKLLFELRRPGRKRLSLQNSRLTLKTTQAVTLRHDALSQTAELNEEVFDALVLLAAGSWQPEDIAAGFAKVQTLKLDMHAGRRARLQKLGFTENEAEELSALHTRNFM